jgi:hypothetical protein
MSLARTAQRPTNCFAGVISAVPRSGRIKGTGGCGELHRRLIVINGIGYSCKVSTCLFPFTIVVTFSPIFYSIRDG